MNVLVQQECHSLLLYPVNDSLNTWKSITFKYWDSVAGNHTVIDNVNNRVVEKIYFSKLDYEASEMTDKWSLPM